MREHDEYGLGIPGAGGRYFFQRIYDEAAIHRRLIEPSGEAATRIEWWERRPGRFREYEKRWVAEGHRCTVDDPEEIAREYRTYRTWRDARHGSLRDRDRQAIVETAVSQSPAKIPVARPDLSGNEERYVVEAIRSSWISSTGSFVTRFEREYAESCGTRAAIGVCNGTIALHLALLGLGVRPGDEVLVPSLTFIATANAVRYVGAEPVFVDVDPDTWCIDPERLEQAVTSRTKGIIAVHLYGHPADMDAINRVAGIHGLWVVEDAAEAHLAKYKGRPTGGLAPSGTFSFYGKHSTSGEGGAVTAVYDPVLSYASGRFGARAWIRPAATSSRSLGTTSDDQHRLRDPLRAGSSGRRDPGAKTGDLPRISRAPVGSPGDRLPARRPLGGSITLAVLHHRRCGGFWAHP